MQRKKTKTKGPPGDGGLYFTRPGVKVFSSGCAVFDCALGGGWAENRIINVVGDRSTGKTLLAIEASANFILKYPTGRVYYGEAESAFDKTYASSIGLPIGRVRFPPLLDSVEDFFDSLERAIRVRKGKPTLYILDSLDALSDRSELARDIDKGSYGAEKAKKMSQVFRRLVRVLTSSNTTVMIVSQVRDRIGVTFGKRTSRTGGRALDFYASQIIELAHIKNLVKVKHQVKRSVGVQIRARVEKNKIATPFREATFPIHFMYGVEDVIAGVEWLTEVKRLRSLGLTKPQLRLYYRRLVKMSSEEYQAERARVTQAVRKTWEEIETEFRPPRRKYE